MNRLWAPLAAVVRLPASWQGPRRPLTHSPRRRRPHFWSFRVHSFKNYSLVRCVHSFVYSRPPRGVFTEAAAAAAAAAAASSSFFLGSLRFHPAPPTSDPCIISSRAQINKGTERTIERTKRTKRTKRTSGVELILRGGQEGRGQVLRRQSHARLGAGRGVSTPHEGSGGAHSSSHSPPTFWSVGPFIRFLHRSIGPSSHWSILSSAHLSPTGKTALTPSVSSLITTNDTLTVQSRMLCHG